MTVWSNALGSHRRLEKKSLSTYFTAALSFHATAEDRFVCKFCEKNQLEMLFKSN